MSTLGQKIIYWLAIATFLVPLVVVPSQFIFPFIVPKILIFRTLVLCLLGIFIVGAVRYREFYRVRWSPITIALGLFLLSFALSTFLGTDWYHSFWDNHERMLGLFTVVHYVLYYLVLTTALRGLVTWKELLRYFMGAASIVMCIGIIQKISPEFLLNHNSNRVSATLGNAIYLGGYGLFTFFMSLLLVTLENDRKWRWYAVITGVLGFIGMIISGTRGSFIGFSVGLGVLLVMYVITLPHEDKHWRQGLSAVVGLLVILMGILFAFRTRPSIANLPTIGPLLNTSLSGTAGTRIMAWQIAIEAWQNRPLFGWGPNNYFYAYNLYYKPQFLEHGWGETWFDNAHNIIMNTLAVQGTVGLLTYLGLFAAVTGVLFRQWRAGNFSPHLTSIGTAFLAAHLVQNIFVFENPTSYLFFMFFIALINSLAVYGQGASKFEREKEASVPKVWNYAAVVAVASLVMVTNVNPARANMGMLKAMQAIYFGKEPVSSYQTVTKISSPHIDDIRNDFARAVMQAAPQYIQAGQREIADTLIRLGISELKKNRALHPYDLRVHVSESQLEQMRYEYFRSVDDVFEAEKTLEDALMKSPDRQQIHFMLSVIKIILNKPDEAIALLQSSVDADDKIGESWWRLAYTYRQIGKLEEARQVLESARQKGVVYDILGQSMVDEIIKATTKK